MIGLIVGHPPIVVILEVDCSAEDGPIPRHHFSEAGRLEGDMMQGGLDDRHCWPPKTFSAGQLLQQSLRQGKVPWMADIEECEMDVRFTPKSGHGSVGL